MEFVALHMPSAQATPVVTQWGGGGDRHGLPWAGVLIRTQGLKETLRVCAEAQVAGFRVHIPRGSDGFGGQAGVGVRQAGGSPAPTCCPSLHLLRPTSPSPWPLKGSRPQYQPTCRPGA